MAVAQIKPSAAPAKNLYEIGEIPPLGHVPEKMYAWAIRKERHGPPEQAMQCEVVPTWPIAEDEVLVYVMAGGVNYNGVWAGLGVPVSPFDGHKHPFHVAGSDASGVVWAVGSKVRRWKVGDEVIVHCNQDDGDDEECNGGDPLLSTSQRIWGYETPDGSFAQFCRVQSRQLMTKPAHLTWEEVGLLHADACHRLSHAVRPFAAHLEARRQCAGLGRLRRARRVRRAAGRRFGRQCHRHRVRSVEGPICHGSRRQGRRSTATISNAGARCRKSARPNTTPGSRKRAASARRSGTSPASATSISCSSIRAKSTFPVSCLVVKRGGMVVFCAGTTGYNITFDARYVWMRQKRIQGSHFAHLKQASAANQFVIDRRVDPCMSDVFPWDKIPYAHELMRTNQHKPGNMAVLVNTPKPGLRNLEDVIEATAS